MGSLPEKMNFRFTKRKIIAALVAGLIGAMYVSKKCSTIYYIQYIPGQPDQYCSEVLSTHSLIGAIGGFVLIYAVWSLFQKQ
jgi:uncharacterized membrane protein YeaQ/YmgE (transglycosylase-associated protein family)